MFPHIIRRVNCNLCVFVTLFVASCSSGDGFIGSVMANGQGGGATSAWEKAIGSAEDSLKRSAIKLAESLKLQADADEADARGDSAAAAEARKMAQAAADEAALLEQQAQSQTQQIQSQLNIVIAEQASLQAQLDQINNANDPLSLQLAAKLSEKRAMTNSIQVALNRIAPLQDQIAALRVELATLLASKIPPRAPNPRYGTGGAAPQNYIAAGKDIGLGWMIDWSSLGDAPLVQQQRMDYAGLLAFSDDDTFMPQGSTGSCVPQTGCAWDNGGAYPVFRCQQGCARPGARVPAHLQKWTNENPSRFRDGMWWMIGNEVGWDDGRSPQTYARVYCKAYALLKGANPTYKVTPGAVLPTSRLYFSDDPNKKHTCTKDRSACSRWDNNYDGAQFFDDFVASATSTAECLPLLAAHGGQLPMDGVLIHLYPSHDSRTVTSNTGVAGDLDKVRATVVAMRQLMQRRGMQTLPLFVKEMGPGGDPTQAAPGPAKQDMNYVRDFASKVFPLFESMIDQGLGMPADGGKLIQRWAWFYTEWNTAVKDIAPWQNIFLYDSRNTDFYRVDSGEPLALTIKRQADRTNPGVPMYRMNMSAGNGGGLYQRIWVSPDREGKLIKFRATAACGGAGATLGFRVSRFPRGGGAKQDDIGHANLKTCDGRWRPLALDLPIPASTGELEVFVMLNAASAVALGAVHDISAKLAATATNGQPADVEVIQNGWLLTTANMSASMGKQNPEPWGFWTATANPDTWGKVTPWKVTPLAN